MSARSRGHWSSGRRDGKAHLGAQRSQISVRRSWRQTAVPSNGPQGRMQGSHAGLKASADRSESAGVPSKDSTPGLWPAVSQVATLARAPSKVESGGSSLIEYRWAVASTFTGRHHSLYRINQDSIALASFGWSEWSDKRDGVVLPQRDAVFAFQSPFQGTSQPQTQSNPYCCWDSRRRQERGLRRHICG
jgi:hypothetical protein